MDTFRQRLESGSVILFDGAMGTEIYRRGVFINRCYDELSRSSPELIREIHAAYRDAGAEVLETNSFTANRYQLQSYGLEEDVAEINRASAALAREVAEGELFVAGSMGPLGVRLEPYGPTSREEAREAFREQAAALADGGADLYSLETFSDLDELLEGVAGCREAADLPVLAQMTIQPDGKTSYGVEPERFARALTDAGADAVGVNCSVGPALLLEAVREMAGVTDLPLSALPNAGLPKEVQGRKMYLASPEYMATYARKLVEAGAQIVGGCCGTGPAHIREMARQLEPVAPAAARVEVAATRSPPAADEAPAREPVPLEERSGWGRRIASGTRVVSVEVPPPGDADPSEILQAASRLEEAGVDALAVPDLARGSVRMSVLAAAALVHRETGMEPIAHYTCRDRNLLGMASDLLGAQALGLRNLLLVTGDPPRMGPYGEATGVFDIDSIGLTNLVRRLNRGEDLGGNPVGSRTSFTVGVAVNPSAVDMERELERWYWKVDAGAEYAVTQPIFEPRQLAQFLETVEAGGTRIPVVAGLWPLTGLRDAEFLNYEVPGIEVPGRVMERMEEAEARGSEAAREEGHAIAREVLEEVWELADGVQVTAPEGQLEPALEVVRALDRDVSSRRLDPARQGG